MAMRNHPGLRGTFWTLATLLISAFVFPAIGLMLLAAFFVIVPALPFVIVPFWTGTWQGPKEDEHAHVHVVDVTPHHGLPHASPA